MSSTISPLKRFFGLLQSDKKAIVNVYFYAIFYGIVSLTLPLGVQSIIGFIQAGQITTSWILLIVVVVVGLLLSGWLQVMQLTISERIQQRIFARSALEFAFRIPRIKMEAMYNYFGPELANRFFDTLTVQKGLSKILIEFSSAVMQIAFGLLLLSFYHPFFILFGLILAFLILVILRFTAKKGMDTSIAESKYKYETAHWLEEIARTLHSFKLSGNTDLHLRKTDTVVNKYLSARKNHFSVLVAQYWSMIGFKATIALALLLVGGILVIDQQMNIGQFVAAEIVILLIIGSVEKLVLSIETIYDVLTALEKMGTLTDLPLEKDNIHKINFDIPNRPFKVELKDVSFKYPDSKTNIIDSVTIKVDAGENAVIVGESGSGKATLIKLLSILFEPSSGVLQINGSNIADYHLSNLRSEIGTFLSDEELFDGTLLENITMGKPEISMDDVMWAIENTLLQGFLDELPSGLHTIINPQGSKLSKSVTQKILLARNIAFKPKLLLFENQMNNFAPLDRKSIISFLTDKSQPWTLISVTNSEFCAQQCDKIIVLEKGKLKTIGSYETIMNSEHKKFLSNA